MRIETERKMKRWRDQRWILDQVIQTRGIDWDQGRTGKIIRNCGPTVEKDLGTVSSTTWAAVMGQLKRIAQAWAQRAAMPESSEKSVATTILETCMGASACKSREE
jgi:hypothetical protein